LLAIDRPQALRRRLTTGRLIVRVSDDPSRYLDAARGAVPGSEAAVEGVALAVRLPDPEQQTPILVAALVAAGAPIQEVRVEIPALEDVYLHLTQNER
jgi:hypothetical protein